MENSNVLKKNIKTIIRKIKESSILQLFILALASLLAFHESFNMYFFRDDFATLYNLSHGIIHPYPYLYLEIVFLPVYKVFNLNPMPYFIYGFIFFMFSAFMFYVFCKELLGNKFLSFIASLIYATSPIGIGNVKFMTTYQSTYLIMSVFLLMLLFFIKFCKSSSNKYYLTSLLLLALSFESFPYRSFFFPIVIGVIALIYFPRNLLSKDFSVKLLIMFGIWVLFFTLRPHFASQVERGGSLQSFLNFDIKQLIFNPPTTSLNVIFHLRLGEILPLIHAPLFISLSLFMIFLIKKLRNKNDQILRPLIFSILFVYLISLSFFIFADKYPYGYDDRYMAWASPGYSLMLVSIYLSLTFIFKKRLLLKKVFIMLLFSLIIFNIISGQIYLGGFNKRRTYVDRFISQLKKFMPTIKTNSVLYFNTMGDADANYYLYDIYAGGVYDQRAFFAVLYGMKIDDLIPNFTDYNYPTFLIFVKEHPQTLSRIYAFSYDGYDLKNITKETKLTLFQALSK